MILADLRTAGRNSARASLPLLLLGASILLASLTVAGCGSPSGLMQDPLTPSNEPVTVTGLTELVGIATGTGHSCGVLAGGSVRCWGWNLYGQVGNGQNGDFRTAPVEVPGLANVRALTAGNEHTCALHVDGTVSCWGKNDFGQLGDGTSGSSAFRTSPVKVQGVAGATAIGAGGYTSCALLVGGSVRCWGLNSFGQVGDGTLGSGMNRTTAVPVVGLGDATSLAVGSSHVCAVVSAGAVHCWGANTFGQLGDGTTDNRASPVQLRGRTAVASISAGGGHTCLAGQDHAFCLGANNSGQLGAGISLASSALVEVSGLSSVSALSAGSAHTCAVLADRTARCWGANADGQLGNASFVGSNLPVTVRGLSNVLLVTAGGGHSCAVLSDHTGRCWGRNNYGQLGSGGKGP